MSFSGKVVIVTGASSGIGAATAVLFASEGARVALVARNETKLDKVAKECMSHGAQTLIIKADLFKEEEVATIIKKTVDHFGQLDVLVNNAGIAKMASVADANILEIYDLNVNTNLRAVVQLTNLAVPHLTATKGNIVNVSSVAANYVVGPSFSTYSISKAGMDHFTRCAALDLGAAGIRVNVVNPGPVKTDMPENMGFEITEAMYKKVSEGTALHRVSEPVEMAHVILFLASDKAKCVTGSAYVADNGMSLKPKPMGEMPTSFPAKR